MSDEPIRVLVVDDDEPVRRMVSLAFELEGFEVGAAQDGLEAIAQTRLFRPDVVVMDIMMPKMDGLTALGHLRHQRETCDLPVLLLSAKADSTDVMIGMRAGATDYVTKPFEADDLVARTRKAIENPAPRIRTPVPRSVPDAIAAPETPAAPVPVASEPAPYAPPPVVETVDDTLIPRLREGRAWTDWAAAVVLVAILVVVLVLFLANR